MEWKVCSTPLISLLALVWFSPIQNFYFLAFSLSDSSMSMSRFSSWTLMVAAIS